MVSLEEGGALTAKIIDLGLAKSLDEPGVPHHPGQLDTHPLVREHFGEQLQSQRTEAWKEMQPASLRVLSNACAPASD